MIKTGWFEMDVHKYLVPLGYNPASLAECVDIIQKNHIDISEFPLPEEFKTFEAYAEEIRRDDEKRDRFAANFNQAE